MVLLTLLAIGFITVATVAALSVITGGVSFVITFGDVIVCIVLLVLIIKYLMKKFKI